MPPRTLVIVDSFVRDQCSTGATPRQTGVGGAFKTVTAGALDDGATIKVAAPEMMSEEVSDAIWFP